MSRHRPVLVTLRARVRQLRLQTPFERVVSCLSRLRSPGASRIGEDAFRVTHFSVQEDHVHLVIEASDRRALSRGMQGLAIRIARGVNAELRRSGTLWDHRFHARALETPTEVRSALVYVLHNRKKHGGVEGPLDPMSSCAWFGAFCDLDDERRAILEAKGWQTRAGPSPVASPRSWLLRTGWRRHGLLSIHESPRLQRRKRRG